MFLFVAVGGTLRALLSFPAEDADFVANREYSQGAPDRKPPDSSSSTAH